MEKNHFSFCLLTCWLCWIMRRRSVRRSLRAQSSCTYNSISMSIHVRLLRSVSYSLLWWNSWHTQRETFAETDEPYEKILGGDLVTTTRTRTRTTTIARGTPHNVKSRSIPILRQVVSSGTVRETLVYIDRFLLSSCLHSRRLPHPPRK